MVYSVSFSLIGVVLGLMAVASNPSPYFAALGLVVVSAGGCWVIASVGASFLSLVLFLVYIGGMMVVFAYSAALTAEPYPEAWGNWVVGWYVVVYALVLGLCYYVVGGVEKGEIVMEDGWSVISGDWGGVSLLYLNGGWLLLVGGLMLLMTLFVVLEMSWGYKGGGVTGS